VPGDGGNVGLGRAAHAPADGYTLVAIDQISYVMNSRLYNNAPYDPAKDFDAVALAVATTQVLTLHQSMSVWTVKDLVALIKADPGKYSLASGAAGSPSNFVGELFRISLGLDLIRVRFNGAGPAITSTIGGDTLIAFSSPAASAAKVKQGNLRALAVTTKTRLATLRDVPTMAESGFPGIECDARIGIFTPARTPNDIISLLNREIGVIVRLPEVKQQLAALGFEPSTNTPEQSAAIVKAEGKKWIREHGRSR